MIDNEAENEDKVNLIPESDGKRTGWNRYSYACLLQYEQELSLLDVKGKIDHKKYSRQGMVKRVLDERRQKADKANYRIRWAKNIYGDHILTNEKGHKRQRTIRRTNTIACRNRRIESSRTGTGDEQRHAISRRTV